MDKHQLADKLEGLGLYAVVTRVGVRIGSAGGAPILVADENGNIDIPAWLAERMDRYAAKRAAA